jgi:hypothetical protein
VELQRDAIRFRSNFEPLEIFDLPRRSPRSCAFLALIGLALSVQPARSQGLLDFLRNNVVAYAPSDDGKASLPPPLSILPVSPRAGDIVGRDAKKQAITTPVPAAKPDEEDEDEFLVYDHDEPKRVVMPLPQPRPGAVQREAEEVAPVGTARWSGTSDQLPPGVNLPGTTLTAPAPPRLASLPDSPSPRWTMSDAPQVRPVGLRESEEPVAHMPGVFAPPEANFDCLPSGIKQVLIDTAKRFGHVAILNAKRSRGSGARESYHYQCRAVDFRVRGIAISTVYGFLRQHPNVGGRKIYPMGFFHVDDGPARSW